MRAQSRGIDHPGSSDKQQRRHETRADRQTLRDQFVPAGSAGLRVISQSARRLNVIAVRAKTIARTTSANTRKRGSP